MNTSPFVILTSLAALASAAAGGMMYVFSTFVMRGLNRTGPVEAITAMRGYQRRGELQPGVPAGLLRRGDSGRWRSVSSP